MARTRIYGKTIDVTVGGVSYRCDLTSAVLTRSEESGDQTDNVATFCDSTSGSTRQVWNFNTTALQSTDSDSATDGESLHTLTWDAAANSGGEQFAIVFIPFNNETPSADQPHYEFTVQVDEGAYPDLGGPQGGDAFTWDYTYVVDGDVTKKISA